LETVYLPLSCLRFSTKKRRGVSPARVEELRKRLEQDIDVLPIRVRSLGDGTYSVADGRHRIAAHLLLGIDLIAACVVNLGRRLVRLFTAVGSFFHGFFFPTNL